MLTKISVRFQSQGVETRLFDNLKNDLSHGAMIQTYPTLRFYGYIHRLQKPPLGYRQYAGTIHNSGIVPFLLDRLEENREAVDKIKGRISA